MARAILFSFLLVILLSSKATIAEETPMPFDKSTSAVNQSPEGAATEESICSTCDCSGDKTRVIDCTERNLQAVPNATLWPQDVEIEARFEHNKLVHIKTFGSIPGLARLSLSHCQVTLIEELAFQQLPNLTFLDLSNNQLTSNVLTPHVFKGQYAPDGYQPLRKMRVLHLGYNAIHTLDQDLFEHLTFLSELSLKFNPLEVLDHSTIVAISSLDYLKVLDLSYTNLKAIPEHAFHSPRALIELHLAGNLFQTVPTNALADVYELKILNLDDNPIRFLDNTSFPTLPTLEHLSISVMPNLTYVGEGTFAGMRSLQELILNENPRFDHIHPEAFKGQYTDGDEWTLRRLHMNNNKLGLLPRELLQRWNALDELELHSNPWVCDCENQWMVSELMNLLDAMNSKTLVCQEPIELRGKSLQDLAHHDSHLRCLDMYGNRPERDGAILVGILIGVLLAVPITMAVFFLWRRYGPSLTGRHPAGPADFSRAFYKRADSPSTISYEHA